MSDICTICCDSICNETNETNVSLPCNHSFHAKCITAWLLKNPSCPVCRYSEHEEQVRHVDQDNSEDEDSNEEPIQRLSEEERQIVHDEYWQHIQETIQEEERKVYKKSDLVRRRQIPDSRFLKEILKCLFFFQHGRSNSSENAKFTLAFSNMRGQHLKEIEYQNEADSV